MGDSILFMNYICPDVCPIYVYRVDREVGRSHEKRYICSVQIEIDESVLLSTGNEKTRIRDAENSAASAMLHGLRESKYI